MDRAGAAFAFGTSFSIARSAMYTGGIRNVKHVSKLDIAKATKYGFFMRLLEVCRYERRSSGEVVGSICFDGVREDFRTSRSLWVVIVITLSVSVKMTHSGRCVFSICQIVIVSSFGSFMVSLAVDKLSVVSAKKEVSLSRGLNLFIDISDFFCDGVDEFWSLLENFR